MPQEVATSLLPDACYRVSAKALIFDAEGRLLVSANKAGEWEIPGGGWEVGETFTECLTRELSEELQAKVVTVGGVAFVYGGMSARGYPKLSITARVTVENETFIPTDDDLAETRFVAKEEFLQLPFHESEAPVLACADKIWAVTA